MKTAVYRNAGGQQVCYACVTGKKSQTRLMGLTFNDAPDCRCDVCGRVIPAERG
jgi:hypothetical protein